MFLVWIALGFVIGWLTCWIMTWKQRRTLKRYRQQAKGQRYWNQPVE
jgi:uncharacterized membrane protein YciS (DUF1049 family)